MYCLKFCVITWLHKDPILVDRISKKLLYILKQYLVIVHFKFTLILGKYTAYLRQAHRCFICLNFSCFTGREVAYIAPSDVMNYGKDKEAFKGISIRFFLREKRTREPCIPAASCSSPSCFIHLGT